MSSSETYPTIGDPAIDEAIRQTFTSLVEMRDAHGTGETPASGTFYTDAAGRAHGIQTDIKGVAKAAAGHWTGDAGESYQQINRQLAT